MSKEKKMTDPEFEGWFAMQALSGNKDLWIYLSPDNLYGALINVKNGDVIFVTDRRTGEKIYSHPRASVHAKLHRVRKLLGDVTPRKLP